MFRLPRPALRFAATTIASWCVVASAPGSRALPIAGIAGYEYDNGVGARTASGAFAGGVASLGESQISLAGARYDQNEVRRGWNLAAGAGTPLSGPVSLQAQFNRMLGDQGDYRAWRARVGPRFALPRGEALQLWYARLEDNAGLRSNSFAFEHSIPVIERERVRPESGDRTSTRLNS